MSEREVKAGGEQFTVRPFNTYQVARLADEVGSILRHAPELIVKLERFRAEYAERSTVLVSRAEVESHPALGEYAKGISEEAWEAAGQRYPLRKTPTNQEQAAAVWHDVLAVVSPKTIGRILALLVIDHEKLRAAWRSDSVDAELDEVAATLLFDADLSDVIDIALAGDAVAREQFGDEELNAKAGKFLAQYGLSWLMTTSVSDESSSEPSESEASQPETKAEESDEAQPTGSPSSPTSPSSSIDSPPPTSGDQRSRSSAPGPSPVASPSV